MQQPGASMRPDQFEMLAPSGAAFKPIDASLGNASSMPGAVTRAAPNGEMTASFGASLRNSVNGAEGSIFAAHDESVYPGNTKPSSLQSYPPRGGSQAAKLVQSLHSPTALMQLGGEPQPSFNPAWSPVASAATHNILLQQLSQYAVPLSYREEVDSYRPPPMAANVIKTLLDPTIKNKKECIQRICAGRKER